MSLRNAARDAVDSLHVFAPMGGKDSQVKRTLAALEAALAAPIVTDNMVECFAAALRKAGWALSTEPSAKRDLRKALTAALQ